MEQSRPVRGRRRPEIQNKKVKQGTKVGGKGLLIGIFLFFILIIGIIFFFFFYLIKNPQVGKSLGLGISAIKSITSVFAGIFFGTFFFLFLILGLSYLFKLATKPTGKFKNALGTFIIFILGLINLGFGFYVFKSIYNIKDDTGPATNEVLVANAIFSKDGQKTPIALFANNYPLIGPIAVNFQLNKRIFTQIYLPQIIKQEGGNIRPVKFVLNCGNGQKITYTSYDFSPYKYCLYLKKGNYNAKLDFYYINPKGENKSFALPEKNVSLVSNIEFKSPIKLNDEKNEIIGGEVGDKITLDITKIPLDLQLAKNDILIDFLGNGDFKDYKGLASFTYNNDGLYNVRFKIPNSSYPTYTFPLRILPSTKPICSISYKENNGKYIIFAEGRSPNGPITKYAYTVVNLNTTNTITRGTTNKFTVNLQDGNSYKVKFLIKDSSGKKGSCSKIINLTDKVTYKYLVNIKTPNGIISTGANQIIIPVTKLPSEFKISINNVKPTTYTEIGFDIDNDNQIDEKGKNLTIKITEKQNKQVNAIVADQYGNKTIKNIKFKIDLKPLVVVLNTDKNNGSAPLTVKFDASSSYTTKPNDNIVLFSWDFGDGETIPNTRQGIITHTYKQPGKYYAKVTIETQQGYTGSATKKIIVFRPVNSASIIFPDNLGGQINIEEPLKIQLNTNGAIKSIKWDFGDGNFFDCNGRECTTIIHTYHKSGLFTITATVNYLDGSPSTKAIAKVNVIGN